MTDPRGIHAAGTLILFAQWHENRLLDCGDAVHGLLQTTFRASAEIVELVRSRLRWEPSDVTNSRHSGPLVMVQKQF